jgi:NADPH:quinone reductase-like Zn-dependent oxidoreductase
MEKGHLKAVIDRVFPLSEAAQAQDYLAQGHSTGKVVLCIVDCQ